LRADQIEFARPALAWRERLRKLLGHPFDQRQAGTFAVDAS
jgi:hypothetical protein